MKKLTTGALAALLAAATSWALQNDSLTFKDGENPAAGVDVVAVTNDGNRPMGTTDAAGVLAGIDPSFFTMKPQGGDIVIQECDGETKTYLNFSDASADGVCKSLSESGQRKCKCKKAGLWMWGEDVQLASTFPTMYVAGGAGAGAVALLLLSGGEDSPAATPTPISTPDVAPPPPPTSFMCVFDIMIVSVQDPAEHRQWTGDPPRELKVTVNGGTITIEGAEPWVTVNGTYDASTGNFNTMGMGVIADRNATATFQGTIQDDRITGTVVWGANGGLPGRKPIKFEIQGNKIR